MRTVTDKLNVTHLAAHSHSHPRLVQYDLAIVMPQVRHDAIFRINLQPNTPTTVLQGEASVLQPTALTAGAD